MRAIKFYKFEDAELKDSISASYVEGLNAMEVLTIKILDNKFLNTVDDFTEAIIGNFDKYNLDSALCFRRQTKERSDFTTSNGA